MPILALATAKKRGLTPVKANLAAQQAPAKLMKLKEDEGASNSTNRAIELAKVSWSDLVNPHD